MSREKDRQPPVLSDPGVRERLESWKEIAAYLGRGVTTVQRWEQEEGLPVHRLPHAKRGSVFAFKPELDGWRVNRVQANAAGPTSDTPAAVQSIRIPGSGVDRDVRVLIALVLGAVVLALIVVIARRGFQRGEARTVNDIRTVSGVRRPLANDMPPEHGPSLSPDGTHVVYDWTVDGVTGLYVKAVEGGPPRRLSVGG